MEVDLIYYTGMESGDPYYAARLLAFTKNTRLNMTPGNLSEFMNKSEAEIDEELDYMSKTIKTALEFADVTFLIRGVSRATAQQITRTRTAVFQMQSQRVSDVSDAGWDSKGTEFDYRFKAAVHGYSIMVEDGMPLEDARDLQLSLCHRSDPGARVRPRSRALSRGRSADEVSDSRGLALGALLFPQRRADGL